MTSNPPGAEGINGPATESSPNIDQAQLTAACEFAATGEEIAAHFGITLEQLLALPGFSEAQRRGDAKRSMLLRQARMKKALKGDKKLLSELLGEGEPALQSEAERLLAEYMAKRSRKTS
jgi:regulator of protease activity HflC (stomatin/prohibitin superfamily)